MDELFSGLPRRRMGRRRLPAGVGVGPATEADAPAIHALYCAVLGEGRWFAGTAEEHPETADWQAQRIRRAAADPTGRSAVLVARAGGGLAGVVIVEGEPGLRRRHLARLEIFLAPAHRGRGIGGALMDAAIAHATAATVLRKLGLVVFADNEAARALYRSRGFVEEGHRVGEYLEADGRLRDDILMARPV